ncbi:MAG: MCE family protein [Candidatus Omnitrophica bacterium]|nr:MCE family protein [Candidatus Omnitrophota bacterium]
MKKISNETKTGALVLAAILVLGVLIFKVGNFSLFPKGALVKARIHYAAGVKKHAPVRLSGVDVGEVKDIRMIYGEETWVELWLRLNEGVKLRADSVAYVTTLGLMGEKYVEIKAGTSAQPYAEEGQMIPAEDPVRLEELIQLGTRVADEIAQMAKDIRRMVNHVDDTVVGNKPRFDHIFKNLDETSENFREFSQDIKYHPWKVLAKGKEKSKAEMEKERAGKRDG